MSASLTGLVTLIYVAIAIDQFRHGQWMGVTFAGYAVANLGIIMSLR